MLPGHDTGSFVDEVTMPQVLFAYRGFSTQRLLWSLDTANSRRAYSPRNSDKHGLEAEGTEANGRSNANPNLVISPKKQKYDIRNVTNFCQKCHCCHCH